MKDVIIEVDNVSMEFKMNSAKRIGLKQYIIRLLKGGHQYTNFKALDSVSFAINKGESVGIIGHNGAGKSTILRLISGILKPTSGTIHLNGEVVPLLGLGAGFDMNFSGYDNIFFNGAMIGKTKKELEERVDEIIEYSELEKFIHTPVKNYSSGMKTKLAFSIAVQIDPDIIILDEVLGVGDRKFRKKSNEKIKELFDRDKTIIFVSHSIAQVKNLCDRVIWIDNGKIVEIGDATEICNKYEIFMDK